MQPQHLLYQLRPHAGFNPHPTRRPGATLFYMQVRNLVTLFQSSPDPEAGCNIRDNNGLVTLASMFQSSPDPEAGCNGQHFQQTGGAALVSILTRPGGRVQRLMIM